MAFLWGVTCIHYYILGLGDGGGKGTRIEFAVIIIPHALRLLSATFLLRNPSVTCMHCILSRSTAQRAHLKDSTHEEQKTDTANKMSSFPRELIIPRYTITKTHA